MSNETGKHFRSSGSSSEETDPTGTIRRSFECTYCKRGFTNAQALGGHMNIHRKDRAKAKKATDASTKNTNSHSDDQTYATSYRPIAPHMLPSTTERGFGNWEAQRSMMMSSSHHMYGPTTPGVQNLPPGGYHPEPNTLGNELGSNLSLRVGVAASDFANWNNNDNNIEDGNYVEDNNEDVDLELRLGP